MVTSTLLVDDDSVIAFDKPVSVNVAVFIVVAVLYIPCTKFTAVTAAPLALM